MKLKEIDVNAKVGDSFYKYTILDYLCDSEQKTTIGVEMLLNNKILDIGGTLYVSEKSDVFYAINGINRFSPPRLSTSN